MARRARTPLATAARACVIAFVVARAWLRTALRRDAAEDEVHRAVVRLGPTAIKIAQVASTRPDLVPPAISRRLESLQEAAPEFSFAEARAVIEAELGGTLEDHFSHFPDTPAASASLSQVYFAKLRDGSDVAVKVQRPGIAERIERDVRVLRALAWALTIVRPRLRHLGLRAAASEFGEWTLRELDFQLEGTNADELRHNFRDWADVDLPTIYWSHTRRRVLTMERVTGRRVGELVQTLGDRERLTLVRRIADMLMKMFDDGLFHADLHPGNIFFPRDGRIVLLDVGMVGRMSRARVDRFLAYWVAVARKQRDRAFHHLTRLALRIEGADLDGYRAAYESILDAFEGSTVTEQSLARTYFEVVSTGARHGVVFPSEMLLQAKALVTMESLCLFMAPEFRFSEEMRPIVARRVAERASPASLVDELWAMMPDFVIAGEWFASDRNVRDRSAELGFRGDAIVAIVQRWVDAADGWIRELKWPDEDTRPQAAALLDLVLRVAGGRVEADGSTRAKPHSDDPEERWLAFRASSRNREREREGAWDRGGPWPEAGPALALPLARVALARIEAAMREHATTVVATGADRPE